MADWKLSFIQGDGYQRISDRPHGTYIWEEGVGIDNYIYEGNLTYTYLKYKGTAAFKLDDGTVVHMFSSDFSDIVSKLNYGRIFGRFTWYKQGPAIGIKLIEDNDGET